MVGQKNEKEMLKAARARMKSGVEQLMLDQEAGLITVEQTMELCEYWRDRINNADDEIYADFFNQTVFSEHLSHSVILSFLVGPDKSIHAKYGIMTQWIPRIMDMLATRLVEGWLPFTIAETGQKWTLHIQNIPFTKNYQVHETHPDAISHYRLVHLLYKQTDDAKYLKNLAELYRNYFIFHLESLVDNYIDLHSFTHAELRALLRDRSNLPLSLAAFRFQKFDDFFKVVGEHMAHEIIDEISGILQENCRERDVYYQLSPRYHMIVAPGTNDEDLKKRLRKLFFQVKGVIIEYKLQVATIKSSADLGEFWQAFAEQKPKKR